MGDSPVARVEDTQDHMLVEAVALGVGLGGGGHDSVDHGWVGVVRV